MDTKNWFQAAGVRALKTFAQALAAAMMLGPVTQALDAVDWRAALSLAGSAAVLSVLNSLAGLPEVE